MAVEFVHKEDQIIHETLFEHNNVLTAFLTFACHNTDSDCETASRNRGAGSRFLEPSPFLFRGAIGLSGWFNCPHITRILASTQPLPALNSMSANPKEDDPLAFVKKRNKVYTLFDHVPADTVNLKMGAPGESLLKKSKEIMKKGSVHKMVLAPLSVLVRAVLCTDLGHL